MLDCDMLLSSSKLLHLRENKTCLTIKLVKSSLFHLHNLYYNSWKENPKWI